MPCQKCNGTGRILLKTYRHGFINCDCSEPKYEREYPYQLTPDMFDFPCSDIFRAFYGNEPIHSPEQEEKTFIVEVERETDLRPIYAQIQDLKRQMFFKKKGNSTDKI